MAPMVFPAVHGAVCASCRLNAVLAAKRFARRRGVVVAGWGGSPVIAVAGFGTAAAAATGTGTATATATATATGNGAFFGGGGGGRRFVRRGGDVVAGGRAGFATMAVRGMPRMRPRWGSGGGGEAARGFDALAEGEEIGSNGGMEGLSIADKEEGEEMARRILAAREEHGDRVPPGVLSERELRMFDALFNSTGAEGMDVGGVADQELAADDGAGTGVLRMADDGALEEIEYDESDEKGKNGKTRKRNKGASEDVGGVDHATAVLQRYEDERALDEEQEQDDPDDEDPTQRTHPLTLANRFGTSPSTLALPKTTFIDPIATAIASAKPDHLAQTAHKVFGGLGLPYSPSTPTSLKTMQQKPIALDAFQDRMSPIEADVFLSCVMPAVFASCMSVLTETRKRMGTAWAENLVRKAEAGQLKILDVGGGGAGVLAVRELLRAEWERMHDANGSASDSPLALAEADGQLGGAGLTPPMGHATVVTGSEMLRKRCSQLLGNTTFIPRLPEYIHHPSEKQKDGKFDLVIAPHSLWSLREDYLRRNAALNLWSLCKRTGGVLVLVEKGVARGFEVVAGAREFLLGEKIASLGDGEVVVEEEVVVVEGESLGPLIPSKEKEKGMIVAPCTNHSSCPMFVQKGIVKGRKDICHFEQRFVRPVFLQKILGARDKNFEDVRFAYVSFVRGRDLRSEEGLEQGVAATESAFAGYEDEAATPHPLSLPRLILPPLKRRGHVILDLCTSAGRLERWTVPRSFSKRAFRDARKSSWGDLWALGAKTRVGRGLRGNKHTGKEEYYDLDVKLAGKAGRGEGKGKGKGKKGKGAGVDEGESVIDTDEYGRLIVRKGGGSEPGEGGQRRTQRVKGVRDKRDKSGKGNGRRKYQVGE
ncbi:hypothetical protein LTR62_004632 [Meristemomyces frigidus]|uniref:Uncharacterized protein n=1 Tax=Meristemomyces frigidus TaxID=1508187 RepID=A0AAN7TEH1_9PEZI|nr:hypothetical protein LTR62_004632 [Meristemomyces frigidus]